MSLMTRYEEKRQRQHMARQEDERRQAAALANAPKLMALVFGDGPLGGHEVATTLRRLGADLQPLTIMIPVGDMPEPAIRWGRARIHRDFATHASTPEYVSYYCRQYAHGESNLFQFVPPAAEDRP
jgi:hypothetical protein